MKDAIHVEDFEDPVKEARRYVQNAKDILNQNGKLDTEFQFYKDRKYVRMAGNTLWNGVLLILDAVFHVKTDERNRPDIRDYQKAVAARDRKLLTLVNTGYDVMHLSMGYDGNLVRDNSLWGFRIANDIIDRCATML
ncbi:MAG: DUF5618 family protein [Bacteroidales bacterium]|nr:DUF5618 family protein [Bacteroidales bacterium]